jgi:hypothetical protein
MYATIQSEYLSDFHCRIKKDPILETEAYKVYELVDSIFNNDIKKQTNNKATKAFRHIALDNQSIGYLFDIKYKNVDLKIGLCRYTRDT